LANGGRLVDGGRYRQHDLFFAGGSPRRIAKEISLAKADFGHPFVPLGGVKFAPRRATGVAPPEPRTASVEPRYGEIVYRKRAIDALVITAIAVRRAS
jgi:hypothetical protein